MRSPKLFICIIAFCFLFRFVHAQGSSEVKTIFHVSAVQIQNSPAGYCDTGACSAKRLTVEGYVNTNDERKFVRYVLSCVELLPRDLAARYAACARVRADNTYSVTIAPDWVQFDTHEESSQEGRPNYLLQAHNIISERAESKQDK